MLQTMLWGSGLIASLIGGALLLSPEILYDLNGIELRGQPSLLNEVRAPGSALLASGAVILSGAIWARMTFTAILLSTLLYLSYGLGRVVSMVVDGIPAPGLVVVAALELAIGLICVIVWTKAQPAGHAWRSQP